MAIRISSRVVISIVHGAQTEVKNFVWSFGVTTLALHTDRIPFPGKGDAEQVQAIIGGDLDLSREKSRWERMKSLVTHLLKVKPNCPSQ